MANLTWGRLLVLSCLLGMVSVNSAALLLADEPTTAVKAGFILKFPAFIEWPNVKDVSKESLVLGFIGQTDIENYLRELVEYSDAQDRRIVVKHLKGVQEVKQCHILFIARSKRDSLSRILSITRNLPILTIGDTDGFAENGVLINFFVQRGRVRFEINQSAVSPSTLKFGFRLFQVARIIEPE